MSLKLHWFLPTSGDSRTVTPFGPNGHFRPPTLEYIAQVAQAADQLGFDGVLTPTGTPCEDAWLMTAALIRETERLKFLVAFRPNALTPTLAAQKAATFQRISDGRLLLNVVTGGDDDEQQRFGDWLDHDQRYARTDEFMTILRGALSGKPFDFSGDHFKVAGATVSQAPDPQPKLYFGGASLAAEEIAAKHVDVYLMWGEPPSMIAPRIARMRQLAADQGRTLTFGIRLHTITRDHADDAWKETQRFLDLVDDNRMAESQDQFARTTSVGQQRMASLHKGSKENLTIAPNLWAGYGLVRSGAATALVGNHSEVADRIEEYHSLGIDEFILSGHPHIEEAYWVGEGVMPELRRRGLLAPNPALISQNTGKAIIYPNTAGR
jgi:alkanesulfonate monooxygenase